MIPPRAVFALAVVLLTAMVIVPARATETSPLDRQGMASKEIPVAQIPRREVYTDNHIFLVRLLTIPGQIPFEKYFDVQFAVFDGKTPVQHTQDIEVSVFAGMRHGLRKGFVHGMESSPRVLANEGVFTVSGLFFHMMGPWDLEIHIVKDGREGVASFNLPCCGP